MSATTYEAEGGPATPTADEALAYLRAFQLDRGRLLVYPRFIQVAQPAAGAEWSATVPSGTTWIVVSITSTLATSAVVATRAPSLALDDGTTVAGRYASAGTQVATLTNRHGWCRGFDDAAQVAGAVDFTAGFPPSPIPPNSRLRTITNALDVGDQWSAIGLYVLQVRERTWQELARYMSDIEAGVHDELFPAFPYGL